MAEAKMHFIVNALPDSVEPLARDRLSRSAQFVQDQGKLRQCVDILKSQYDEALLSPRLLRLVTKMVLAERYGEDNWKDIYKQIGGAAGGQLVLNVELPAFIINKPQAFINLRNIYYSMGQKRCNPDRMNDFMQRLVNQMTMGNMGNVIKNLRNRRRSLITKILHDNAIDKIVREYIPSE